MEDAKYQLVRNLPVAEFYYKGSHSHPVRRKVLIHKLTPTLVVGYELREGNEVRPFRKAPVKSYSRSKIANFEQCRKPLRERVNPEERRKTTFRRSSLFDLVKEGI